MLRCIFTLTFPGYVYIYIRIFVLICYSKTALYNNLCGDYIIWFLWNRSRSASSKDFIYCIWYSESDVGLVVVVVSMPWTWWWAPRADNDGNKIWRSCRFGLDRANDVCVCVVCAVNCNVIYFHIQDRRIAITYERACDAMFINKTSILCVVT